MCLPLGVVAPSWMCCHCSFRGNELEGRACDRCKFRRCRRWHSLRMVPGPAAEEEEEARDERSPGLRRAAGAPA